MRLAFFLTLALLMNSPARDLFFYVGTYTHDGTAKGVYLGRIDAATGAPGPLALAAEAKDPSFLALAPDGKTLYAALEGDGAVAAFRVGADRELSPLGTRPSGGGTCHVSATAERVYAANYGAGSIAAFPVGPGGALGDRSGFLAFAGSGPNPKRQEKPHAHSIYPDPAGGGVYACDLGTDRVVRLDPGLAPLGEAHVPPGAGARHLAFSADGKTVYAINEMGLSVTVFARDGAGGLSPVETVPLLPAGTDGGGSTAAEVVLAPDGKRLYASIRGDDSLVVLAVGDGGKLRPVQRLSAGVKGPRSIALDPSGRWLLAAGEKGGGIAVFRVDPAAGTLAPTGGRFDLGAAVCVLFAP